MVTYQRIFLFKSETCEKAYFCVFFDTYLFSFFFFLQLIIKIRREGNTVMSLQEISFLVFEIISLLLAHLCADHWPIPTQVGVRSASAALSFSLCGSVGWMGPWAT